MSEKKPKCLEVTVGSSCGGSVQIVKYEYTAKFDYWMSAKYSVEDLDWTEQDVEDFQRDKAIQTRGLIEGLAEAEMEELLKERDEHEH